MSKYSFSVKLIAPEIEQKTANGKYSTEEMESQEATILCHSKPAAIEGKNQKQNF